MSPAALANLVALAHLAWVAFLALGLAAILLGIALRWGWIRNPWFRSIHLAMIAAVVVETLVGAPCPLTVWERRLRLRAGQRDLEGDFIAAWVHRLLYFEADPRVFAALYVAFGLAVLVAWYVAPPRWRKHEPGRAREAPTDRVRSPERTPPDNDASP